MPKFKKGDRIVTDTGYNGEVYAVSSDWLYFTYPKGQGCSAVRKENAMLCKDKEEKEPSDCDRILPYRVTNRWGIVVYVSDSEKECMDFAREGVPKRGVLTVTRVIAVMQPIETVETAYV